MRLRNGFKNGSEAHYSVIYCNIRQDLEPGKKRGWSNMYEENVVNGVVPVIRVGINPTINEDAVAE